MRRIPTLFHKEDGLVSDEYNVDTKWVRAGLGIPTYKWDGIAVMNFSGVWYFRRTVNNVSLEEYRDFMRSPTTAPDSRFPYHFKLSQYERDRKQAHGWQPAFASPYEPMLIEALRKFPEMPYERTYELVGPEISGNPHGLGAHELRSHGMTIKEEVPTDYEGLKDFLQIVSDAEGIVWHSLNSLTAKIKKSDFGIEWPHKDDHIFG